MTVDERASGPQGKSQMSVNRHGMSDQGHCCQSLNGWTGEFISSVPSELVGFITETQ